MPMIDRAIGVSFEHEDDLTGSYIVGVDEVGYIYPLIFHFLDGKRIKVMEHPPIK